MFATNFGGKVPSSYTKVSLCTPVCGDTYAPVAQLDRAFACGARGRTFESCRVYQSKRLVKASLFTLVNPVLTRDSPAAWRQSHVRRSECSKRKHRRYFLLQISGGAKRYRAGLSSNHAKIKQVYGQMQEWLNWLVSKTSVPSLVPRVRIPLCPPRYNEPRKGSLYLGEM